MVLGFRKQAQSSFKNWIGGGSVCTIFRLKSGAGFTMLEAVVVIGMIGLVGAVVLANFPRLNQQIALRRSAEDLNTAIRKAQNMALAVRIVSRKNNTLAVPRTFGVYVESEQLMGIASTSYYLFAEPPTNPDRRYRMHTPVTANNGTADIALEVIHTVQPVAIKNVRAELGSQRDKLHITFSVPDGGMVIRSEDCEENDPNDCSGGGSNRSSGCVRLEAPNGTFLSVVARNSGQILIDENQNCD